MVNKLETQATEIKTLKSAFHQLESANIERDEKINNMMQVCEKILNKIHDIEQVKQDVDKMNKIIEKFSTMIEQKFKENQCDKDISEKLFKELQKVNIQGNEIQENIRHVKQKTSEIEVKLKEFETKTGPQINEVHQIIKSSGIKEFEGTINEVKKQVTDLKTATSANFKILERVQEVNLKCAGLRNIVTEISTNQSMSNRNSENTLVDRDNNQISKEMANDRDTKKSVDSDSATLEIHDLYIIGSSVTKDLYSKQMYRNRKVRINTLNDKTVEGAIQFVKSGKVKAKNIFLQIGSNDLEHKSPDNVMQQVEELCATIKSSLPTAQIVLGELLPRYYRDRFQTESYNEKRHMYNTVLKDFCNDTGFVFVEFGSMRMSDFYDGIHLTEQGVKFYVKCLKDKVNVLLGVKYEKQSDSFHRNRTENTQYGPGRNTYDRREYNYRQNITNGNDYSRNTQGRREQYDFKGDNLYTRRYNFGTRQNNWYNPDQEKESMFRMFEYMLQGMRDKGF